MDRILFGHSIRASKTEGDESIFWMNGFLFLGLLMDGITDTVKETMEMQNALFVFGDCLKKIKAECGKRPRPCFLYRTTKRMFNGTRKTEKTCR